MKYIPQAAPFIMIDRLLHDDEAATKAAFVIPEGHLFVDGLYFTEPGILEHMAQTAAAGMGHRAESQNRPPPVGYIGAIKNWKLIQLPRVGTEIFTTVKTLNTVGLAFMIAAQTEQDGHSIAEAEFTIFLQQNP